MKDTLKSFISYYKPHKKVFFTDLFCAFLGSAIALLYPLLVRYVTGTAQTVGLDMGLVGKICFVFIALALVEYVCNYYIDYIGHVMGAKMEFAMRRDLFGHYQKLSLSYYDNAKTGQLMSRLTNDLSNVTELAHHGPEDIVISTVKIIGSFFILVNINVPLTLIIFAVLPVMGYLTVHYNKKMRKAYKKNRESIAEVNNRIEDSISGIRVVKSFANEHVEIEKFALGNNNYVESKRDSYHAMGLFYSWMSFFITFINILMIFFGALFISKNLIDVSDLITYLMYIGMLIEPVRKLMNFTEQFQNGFTGFERFLEIMKVEPDIVDKPDARDLENVRGEIEFKNVSFSYDTNAEKKNVFSGIDIKIDAGDYVALVGPSGVGKTTLCSLIPRFYEPSEGSVLVDGNDIKDLKLDSLREHIGIVQQDIYLFAGTVRENIEYGKPGATFEEITQAAKNANAHDFISELPDGYDTYIGQRGVKLSGGQKQRLSIARVFLKNPPILIFDEATSSLDNESEKIVQDSLEKLASNRTTVCIAHRLSTIRNAKTILVLSAEGIAERGTHEELIRRGGVYANYYALSGAVE